jgi:hypothetical protein
MREKMKGNKHASGRKLTEEQKDKIGKYWKGRIRKPFSEEHRRKLSESNWQKKNYGVKSPYWIPDRSLIKVQDRINDPENKKWRTSVYKRDKYICKISNKDCNGILNAHHILPWRDYPELRYDINNGITLCKFHHPLKRADEQRLTLTFQELIKI